MPFNFGCLTTFQFTRWNFFPQFFPPCQRNFLNSTVMLFIIDLGVKRTMLLKMGRDERIDLIRVTFPARLSHLIPEDWTLFLIFWRIGFHSLELAFFLMIGTPGYLKEFLSTSTLQLRAREISPNNFGLQFHPYTQLFSELALPLEAKRKRTRFCLKCLARTTKAPPRRILSLANWAWFIGSTPLLITNPGIEPSYINQFSPLLKESSTKI